MAFTGGLSSVEGMSFQDVIFELDFKVIIDSMCSQREDSSYFGIVIYACCEVHS